MLNYIVRTREVIAIIMICWLQFDLYIKSLVVRYSPKSLYRHHGVGIYDNNKPEECSPLVPASLAYSKSVHRVLIALFVECP